MLKIRAGEWDTQTRDELFPHQDRGVSEIIIHENYYKGGLFNDIALLLLREPVELSEIVNTACLPPQDHNFDGTRCFASGWGKDVWGKEGKYQVILKKIDLPIVPRQPCQEKLRRTRLGQHFNLHSSFVCAGKRRFFWWFLEILFVTITFFHCYQVVNQAKIRAKVWLIKKYQMNDIYNHVSIINFVSLIFSLFLFSGDGGSPLVRKRNTKNMNFDSFFDFGRESVAIDQNCQKSPFSVQTSSVFKESPNSQQIPTKSSYSLRRYGHLSGSISLKVIDYSLHLIGGWKFCWARQFREGLPSGSSGLVNFQMLSKFPKFNLQDVHCEKSIFHVQCSHSGPEPLFGWWGMQNQILIDCNSFGPTSVRPSSTASTYLKVLYSPFSI